MRRIGTLADKQSARVLGDYLYSQEIDCQVDPAGDEWAVWVHEEDDLEQARSEYDAFLKSPTDPKYTAAAKQAERRREAKIQAEIAAKKRQIRLRDRWERPPILQLRVTLALIALSVAATIGFGFGAELDPVGHLLLISKYMDPGSVAGRINQLTEQLQSGQIWRLVTPIFLHFSVLHLVFNLYWTAMLGGMIERTQGSWRLLLLVLAIAVISNLVQYFATSNPLFGGMSGVVFGLFGYVWLRSKYELGSPYFFPPQTAVFFLIWMIICSLGVVGGVANHAHSAGLVVGLLLGLVPVLRSRAR